MVHDVTKTVRGLFNDHIKVKSPYQKSPYINILNNKWKNNTINLESLLICGR